MKRKQQSTVRCVGPVIGLLAGSVVLAQPVAPVRYTEAASDTVRESVTLPGTVETRRLSVVASEAAGLVVELDAEAGDVVRRGQVLARLRQVPYKLQLKAAEGRLKEAEARRDLADTNLERARRLFDEEIISRGERDDAFSEFTAWQGRVDQTIAEIDLLSVTLDRCGIKAPFSGVIVDKRTEVGQWLALGGEVVTMVALDDLQVRVDVPSRYYDLLQARSSAELTFESISGLQVKGTVHGIVPRADARARTFPVNIRIPNPDRRIGVGMLARVALPVGRPVAATIVPKDAIVRQGPQEMVYRIKDDDTVEPVPVRTGQATSAWIVVDGVAPGDRVVTRGNERLQPGQAIVAEPLEYPAP